MDLTLLGTAGGPGGHAQRAGISSLITEAGRRYLVDAGDAVTFQLARAGHDLRDIDVVFLTHLHDDHTAGLPGLLSFRHTMRGAPLEVVGPPGTRELITAMIASFAVNHRIRTSEMTRPGPGEMISARDAEPGEIHRDAQVAVTAVENTHYARGAGGGPDRSYALRFDGPSRSIVFTGDTGESDAVAGLATGADVLVSEMVTAADLDRVPPPVRAHMIHEHLTAAQVGALAATAGVGTVVLSHYTEATEADLAAISAEYSGSVVAGSDLMVL